MGRGHSHVRNVRPAARANGSATGAARDRSVAPRGGAGAAAQRRSETMVTASPPSWRSPARNAPTYGDAAR